MKFRKLLVALYIAGAYSASKIFIRDDSEPMRIAAANIVERCFGTASERWTELLIIVDQNCDKIAKEIHHKAETSNLVLSLDDIENSSENSRTAGTGNKTNAIMVNAYSVKQVASLLQSLKNNFQRLWRPRSYFLIVIETRCDVAELNDMFKVLWDYWILNAIVLCSSNNSASPNDKGIELYTYNPYSADHKPQWEIVINETVEVPMSTGNFNHSWYIFEKKFTQIRYLKDCDDLYFDKTQNLDGYVVPISVPFPENFFKTIQTAGSKWYMADRLTLETLAKLLRFDFAQVTSNYPQEYGFLLENGSYTAPLDDVFNGRSHIAPMRRSVGIYPGLDMAYPEDLESICIASRKVGLRSRWTNLADEIVICISFGLSLLFITVFLYFRRKSEGIISAFLNAQRLLIGSTLINTSNLVKDRIILGSMFLVVLVLDGAVRGRFISILTIVRPYPNIETLEEVRRQGIYVYGTKQLKHVMTDHHLDVGYYRDVYSPEVCVDSLDQDEHKKVCLTNCVLLTYQLEYSSNVHKASVPVSTYYKAIVTAKHWPMTNRWSFGVQKLIEAGIFGKWKSDAARIAEIQGWKQNRALQTSIVKPTKVHDLLPAFVLLFVGLPAALIAFAWEMKGGRTFRCLNY